MVEIFTLALLFIFICSGLVITWLTPASVLNTPATDTDNAVLHQGHRPETTINKDLNRGFSFSNPSVDSEKINPTHIMKKLIILVLVSGFMALAQFSNAQSYIDMEGTWTGDIKGTPVEFTFNPTPDRAMEFKLNALAQNIIGYAALEKAAGMEENTFANEDGSFFVVLYTNLPNSQNESMLYKEFAAAQATATALATPLENHVQKTYIAKVKFTNAAKTELTMWVDYNRDGFTDTITATEYKLTK